MSRFEAIDAIENGYWQQHASGAPTTRTSRARGRFREDETAEPYSQRSLRYTYHGLDLDKVEAMLGLNAIEVYGLDGEALHEVAQKINAPTRAEIDEPLDEIPADGGLWAFRTVGAFM